MPEILVDANLLLRYLTDEPRALADRAAAILEAAEQRRVDLVVAPLILAEVVYVLQSVYHWERQVISERLGELIAAEVIVFLEGETVARALGWYRDIRPLDFADAYLAAAALARGHGVVASFDGDLRRVPRVTVVDQPDQVR
jgi:predicted nucleic acid-binding protein